MQAVLDLSLHAMSMIGLILKTISVSGKTEFLPKIAYGLWQEISCLKVLVVSDIKVIFKCCKRNRHSESLWVALKWGLNFGWLTQRFMENSMVFLLN